MSKQIKWIKKGKMGNYLAEWTLVIEFEKLQLEIFRIIQFKKGEFVLPQRLFPRDECFNAQKEKSLIAAKKKCEAFLKRLSNELNKFYEQ